MTNFPSSGRSAFSCPTMEIEALSQSLYLRNEAGLSVAEIMMCLSFSDLLDRILRMDSVGRDIFQDFFLEGLFSLNVLCTLGALDAVGLCKVVWVELKLLTCLPPRSHWMADTGDRVDHPENSE